LRLQANVDVLTKGKQSTTNATGDAGRLQYLDLSKQALKFCSRQIIKQKKQE
jgi:hypothetical protein